MSFIYGQTLAKLAAEADGTSWIFELPKGQPDQRNAYVEINAVCWRVFGRRGYRMRKDRKLPRVVVTRLRDNDLRPVISAMLAEPP